MITYKGSLLFLIAASFFKASSAFSFSFSLDRSTVQVGEATSLRILVPFSKEAERPLVFDELLTRHKKLKVLEQQAQKTPEGHQLVFEITAYEPDEYRIPPIQIKMGPDTFSTEAMPLQVTTTRQKDDIDIRPEFEPLKKPFPWRTVYAAAMWFLVGSVLIWWTRWALSKVSWRALFSTLGNFSLPRYESRKVWLKHEIKRIKNRLASENQENEILDDAFFTLKKFFEKGIKKPVPAWTQKELQARLSETLNRKHLSDICSEIERLQYHTADKTNTQQKIYELLGKMEKELL